MTKNKVNSSLLLASSVHDIKNSLGMLLHTLEDLIGTMEFESEEQRQKFAILRGESARINNALISLLGIYRLKEKQLPVSIQEVYVADFLEDQIAQNQLLFDMNDVTMHIDCDPNLVGYFDTALITGVINNILVNASRYTKSRIDISARLDNGNLVIEIGDDGKGYPKQLLKCMDNENRGVNFGTGSTNLGLFFCSEIAKLHRHGENSGYIELINKPTGGGLFRLTLPN